MGGQTGPLRYNGLRKGMIANSYRTPRHMKIRAWEGKRRRKFQRTNNCGAESQDSGPLPHRPGQQRANRHECHRCQPAARGAGSGAAPAEGHRAAADAGRDRGRPVEGGPQRFCGLVEPGEYDGLYAIISQGSIEQPPDGCGKVEHIHRQLEPGQRHAQLDGDFCGQGAGEGGDRLCR